MKDTTVKRLAYKFARAASPRLHKLGLESALNHIETYSAFLSGRGSGHGWDHQNEVNAIASFVPHAPAIIFDVGANNGAWSLRMAKALGNPENRFFLFECAPYCFDGIEERRSGIPNLTLLKCAVSDHEGTAVLNLPTRGSGLASLHERRDVSISREEYRPLEVEARTLDSIASDHGVFSIDLLKLDIEGHELFAMRGANRLIESGSVKIISFEFGSGNVNSRTFFRDFWELLTGNRYELLRILPGGGVAPIKKYTEELEYFRGATNYIARRLV